MTIWTDTATPGPLSGFARELLDDLDTNKSTLAEFLPNQETEHLYNEFEVGLEGLAPLADYRSWDAEPTFGDTPGTETRIVKLAPLGRQIQISEEDQQRAFSPNASDAVKNSVYGRVDRLVRGVAARIEMLRGQAIVQSKIDVQYPKGAIKVDFGRDPSLTINLPTAQQWTSKTVSRLDQFDTWTDVYGGGRGIKPGAWMMSTRVFRHLTNGAEFSTVLMGGAERKATIEEVQNLLQSYGHAPIIINDRHTAAGRVIPDNVVVALPAPGSDTALGATLWGITANARKPEYGIAPSEQPGIFAMVHEPVGAVPRIHVVVDALAVPVVINPNLSLVATVLPAA